MLESTEIPYAGTYFRTEYLKVMESLLAPKLADFTVDCSIFFKYLYNIEQQICNLITSIH